MQSGRRKSTCFFTVTFEVEGAVYAEVKTQGNEPIKIPDDPIKSGYIFDGWYWDKDTWLEPFTVASLATRPLQENIRVYAKWITDQEAQLGKVTFVTNGGTAIQSARFETIEESPVSVREGYILEGWYTDVILSNKVTFPFVVDGDTVLYAKWSAIEYTIEYRLDGGQIEASAPYSYTIETNVKLPVAEKTGYTFEGWYATEDFEGQQIENISAGQTGNKVFYAKWTINSYTIIFESNGGTDVADITENFGEPIEKPADPEKIGYVFIGWYSNSTCTEPFEFDTMPASDIRLYAKWQAERYSIKYNLNGGSLEGEYHTEYTYEEAYTLPIPEKSNFVFAGWYGNPFCSGDSIVNIAKGSIGTKEFWAKWEEQGYSITYHLNGGVNGDNTPIYYASSETIILEPASKTGYTFMGWYENEDFEGEKITEITTGSSGNKELWAKWQINQYTITFDTNGGSPINNITQDYGSRVVVPSDPERAGYTFIGWFADSTLVHEYVFTTISAEDITVYAKWDVVTYDITFNADGAELPTDIALSYTVEDNITLPLIEKAGHTFNGWYDNAAFEGDVITEIAKGTIGDKQYYAKFTVNQYTLTYEVNGGSAIESVTQDYATKLTKPADPTKIGYEFIGWYSDAEFMNEFLFGTMPDKNMTIYAKWQIVFYSIEYIADDAVIPDDAAVKYTVEDEVVLPVLEKIGYTFDGWYNNAEFAGESIEKIEIGTTGDKTYYAKFTINSYTIEFETFGGSVIDSITQNYGTTIIAPQQPQRLGYSFVGWYSDADFTNEFLFTTMPANDITVYAKWSAIVYEIHYYNVEDASNTNPLTYTVEDSFILRAPVRNGYNFAFWYQNGDIDVRITEIAKGTTGDLYLYASWIKADNGYSIVTAPNYAFISDTELKTVINYDVTEFDFRGTFTVSPNAAWRVFTEENCSQPSELTLRTATDLQEGDNYYYVLVENQSTYQSQVYTLNVHRRWQYEVNFYGKDGSLITTTQLIEGASITDEMIPAASDLTNIGYRLLGWYFDSAFEEEYAVGSAILKNQKTINLYSEYEAIVYSITYVLDGGENAESNVAEYTVESESLLLADPSRTDFSFDGWWLSDSYEEKITEIHPTDLKDYTLYAKWVPYLIEKDDDGNVTIISYTGTEQDVDIPSAINGCPVTAIGENAFNGRTDIVSVKIPDSVTNIGRSAFYNCTSLTSVTIPDSVTSIGDSAFSGCTGLTSITIPDSVTSIGTAAFSGCTGLTSVTIPDSVKSIRSSAFSGCTGLTSITIPDSVTSIGVNAFRDCDSLTSITIPDNVTSIGDYAFYGCDGLTSVTIGDSVTSIGERAFYGCTGLTSITIPDSVTSIGDYAFYGCTDLTSITIGDSVTSIGSYAFNGCSSLTSVIIPDSVTSIGERAFSGCSSLENITIPFVGAEAGKTSSDTYQDPLGYIFGTSSYAGGTAVRQYYYGYSTSSTTYSTYYIPSSLRSVTVTGGNILYGAFYNCSMLTSINIPDSVTSIGDYAFYGCDGLTSITIPDSVTSIGRSAFYGCTGLTSVTIPDSVTSIGDYAFYGCDGLTSITIPDSVTSIGRSAFYGCTGLTSVTIPDSVTSIGSGASSGCSSLESITIPFVGGSAGKTSSYTYQYPFGYIFGTSSYTGGMAVSQCYYGSSTSSTTWTTYYIPSSLRNVTVTGGNILYGAFYNCSMLTSINIPDSVTSIGERAFDGCIAEIVWGDNPQITEIGSYAFSWYEGTSITIPDSVTSIGDYAFYGCDGLTSITIPDSVTSIGERAFYGCSGLTSVTIGNGVTSIGIYAFSGCTTLLTLVVGEGVQQIGINAFSDCTALESVVWNSVSANDLNASSGVFENAGSAGEGIVVTVGDKVEYIPAYLFYLNAFVKNVVFGANLPRIGDNAFTSIISNSVVYEIRPEGLTAVGYSGTESGAEIVIMDGTVAIAYSAFKDCTTIAAITIPDSVKSIGSSAFSGCSGLTSIVVEEGNPVYHSDGNCLIETVSKTLVAGCKTSVIPNDGSVTSMEMRAFSGCTGLTSIIIPDSVTSIGSYAFDGCIAEIVWGDNPQITEIGSYAFSGYEGTSITIPDSVTSIGSYAFDSCTGLKAVYISDIAAWCGISFSLGSSTANPLCYAHNLYLNGELVTNLIIPDGVTSIGAWAFFGCTSLASVTIPDSVASIEVAAFAYCDGLTSIVVEEGNPVYHSDGNCLIETVSKTLVVGCKTSVIPNNGSVTSIGSGAFLGCSGLTSIVIPDSITSIGIFAFSGCTGLTSVTFKGTIEQWNTIGKFMDWKDNCPFSEVVCSDGTVNV